MGDVSAIQRPQRWDKPFGEVEMSEADFARLMARPEIASIDASRFPAHIPLAGILRNDARLVRYRPGDIVVREGDYGSSAFLILSGSARVVLPPGLPRNLLGRQEVVRRGVLRSVAQLWTNSRVPEARDPKRLRDRAPKAQGEGSQARVFLQDIPAVLDEHRTALLVDGQLFGELAALGRVPRTATVFAETEAELLEIRWQGLRELKRFDDGWKRRIDEVYRANALKTHLAEVAVFYDLDDATLSRLADCTLFETYGTFDWHVSYRQRRGAEQDEPVIARQGDYPDGMLLIRAGFARVSQKLGAGERTLTYFGAGNVYGIDELYDSWRRRRPVPLETTLTALGYVDVLRIPAPILEEVVLPKLKPRNNDVPRKTLQRLRDLPRRPLVQDGLLEWAVGRRLINGTKAMLIDLERCVRCDDCVRACAATHGGNPRFVRHGPTFDHWMVANACMHCTDPVCMIGCPTGAIHRTQSGGNVVINDDTCIGCGTCAASCPYDNIRMVDIRDPGDAEVVDEQSRPIRKATKCDFCADQLGGPACVRACPHDAMVRVDFRKVARGDLHVAAGRRDPLE